MDSFKHLLAAECHWSLRNPCMGQTRPHLFSLKFLCNESSKKGELEPVRGKGAPSVSPACLRRQQSAAGTTLNTCHSTNLLLWCRLWSFIACVKEAAASCPSLEGKYPPAPPAMTYCRPWQVVLDLQIPSPSDLGRKSSAHGKGAAFKWG